MPMAPNEEIIAQMACANDAESSLDVWLVVPLMPVVPMGADVDWVEVIRQLQQLLDQSRVISNQATGRGAVDTEEEAAVTCWLDQVAGDTKKGVHAGQTNRDHLVLPTVAKCLNAVG